MSSFMHEKILNLVSLIHYLDFSKPSHVLYFKQLLLEEHTNILAFHDAYHRNNLNRCNCRRIEYTLRFINHMLDFLRIIRSEQEY